MVLSKPFIIADIGSNWCRGASNAENLDMARRAVKAAATARCNAVKFQLYTHEELYGYKEQNRFELPVEWLSWLREEADKANIQFMCTAFSPKGVEVVNDYVQIHKVASSDMKNVELLEAIAKTSKPLILSTGSSHYLEIQWVIQEWKDMSKAPLCVLDCVGAYPADASSYHLNLLGELYEHVEAVGVSDHTLSNIVALTSIGFGGTVFEKHFDPYKNMGFCDVPDSCVSIGPTEMSKYVEEIRLGFLATETLLRRPRRCEDDFQTMHRRRVIALKDVKAGEKLERNVNFGAFRVKNADFHGAPMEKVMNFDGKVLKNDVKALCGIASSDILI